ncbi:MAG: ABC transporter permease [Roseovarius sp.]
MPASRAETLRTVGEAPFAAKLGMGIVLAYLAVAIFAPLLAPFSQSEIVGGPYEAASARSWLGTDALGRDFLTRILYGIRNTVGIALITTVVTFLFGAFFGLLAAVRGGWVDQLLSRIVDILMSIPALIFKLLLLSIAGASIVNLILIVAFVDSTRVFRLSRAAAGDVAVMEYIEAARLRGENLLSLMFRETLPNIIAPLAAEFGVRFSFVFLVISSLSFLGIGIQPPAADLGSMVRENAALISFGRITPLIPAFCIGLLTIGVNFMVDWLLHLTSGLKD